MTSLTMTSSVDLRASLDLIEVKPGTRFSLAVLQDLLPDVETLLFFGKVYDLDYRQLSSLMSQVIKTDLAQELFHGSHSEDLQDYLVGSWDEHGNYTPGIVDQAEAGDIVLAPEVPHGEILPQMWEQLEVEVAASIKTVASKLESVVSLLPGKQGKMVFSQMMKLNAKRPVIGDYRAGVHHDRQKQNLVILDVSGSMTRHTVETIIGDVIALSYNANAHMAIVSDDVTYWEPGTYDVAGVLAKSQFSGTHYEQLESLLNKDWGTVITVADYDSSPWAKDHLAAACRGTIDEVLDISLVYRPSFLAECVGQFATKVRPLLIGQGTHPSQLA